MQEFFDACAAGDRVAVQRALEEDASLSHKLRAVSLATARGHADVCRVLLQANPRCVFEECASWEAWKLWGEESRPEHALVSMAHAATTRGDVPVLRALLRATYDSSTLYPLSVMHMVATACAQDALDVFKELTWVAGHSDEMCANVCGLVLNEQRVQWAVLLFEEHRRSTRAAIERGDMVHDNENDKRPWYEHTASVVTRGLKCAAELPAPSKAAFLRGVAQCHAACACAALEVWLLAAAQAIPPLPAVLALMHMAAACGVEAGAAFSGDIMRRLSRRGWESVVRHVCGAVHVRCSARVPALYAAVYRRDTSMCAALLTAGGGWAAREGDVYSEEAVEGAVTRAMGVVRCRSLVSVLLDAWAHVYPEAVQRGIAEAPVHFSVHVVEDAMAVLQHPSGVARPVAARYVSNCVRELYRHECFEQLTQLLHFSRGRGYDDVSFSRGNHGRLWCTHRCSPVAFSWSDTAAASVLCCCSTRGLHHPVPYKCERDITLRYIPRHIALASRASVSRVHWRRHRVVLLHRVRTRALARRGTAPLDI